MGKQCWSQAVLESGSWGHSVLQTPALVPYFSQNIRFEISCKSSLSEAICMKFQILFPEKKHKNYI